VVSYKDINFTLINKHTNTMTKFQKVIGQIGYTLIGLFGLCVVLTILVSDYRGEEEYRQYVTIQQFLLNWYTLTMCIVGMLFVTFTWFKFDTKKKNRPTTF
jgi:Na+-driven multidrug efflux pump